VTPRALLVSLVLVVLAACGDAVAQHGEHCAHCGMTIADGSGFTAGATASTGAAVWFDAPKCLFRWLGQPAGSGATGAWVTEYFTRARTPVDDALYVLGSDIDGPMGRDVVPVAPRDRAEHFASSHGGRVLSRSEVTPDVIEGLFGR
jgi:copper chaperone NosL